MNKSVVSRRHVLVQIYAVELNGKNLFKPLPCSRNAIYNSRVDVHCKNPELNSTLIVSFISGIHIYTDKFSTKLTLFQNRQAQIVCSGLLNTLMSSSFLAIQQQLSCVVIYTTVIQLTVLSLVYCLVCLECSGHM